MYLTLLGSPPRLCRLTQFVAFQPKKFRTQKVLESKIKCVLEGGCMNHWASLAFRVPIVAFPSWTEKAKEIPVRVPTFDMPEPTPVEEPEEPDDLTEDNSDGKKRKKGSTRVSKKKKAGPPLPADILAVL